MTTEEIAAAPLHPQLMDPAGPAELIVASIWWYPRLFTHRTAVLQHLLLTAGNGYEWGPDGQIRSVFSHLPPDYSTLSERQARTGGDAGRAAELQVAMEDWERRDLEELTQVRATARQRARTYGPVTISAGSRRAATWGLLAARPERVHPRWRGLLEEAERVFAAAWAEQDAAEAGLRRQWDRNPAARAAQLLTGELGRAWVADLVTDAELDACDQLLATWRHPSWPCRLDRRHLAVQRDRSRTQRAIVSRILDDLSSGDQATPAIPAGVAGPAPQAGASPRPAAAILQALAGDQLTARHFPVRPVPFTGWHEWQWALDLIRERIPAPGNRAASLPAPARQKQPWQPRPLGSGARNRTPAQPRIDDMER